MSEDSKFTLIPDQQDHPLYADTYGRMWDVVGAHHDHLVDAAIALAWMHEVKPDRDGRLVWGRTRKVSSQERIFHNHDFVITLNCAVWAELDDQSKRALIDHELSHCGSKTNDEGEVSYYLRKHDLEEFVGIVRRYGLWKSDIEAFVNAAVEARARAAGEARPVAVTESDEEAPAVHAITRVPPERLDDIEEDDA